MNKASSSESRRKNPKWTQDELVLALELFFRLDSPSAFSSSNPKVIALSDDLNRLRSAEATDEKFRNANGVAMKLHNFSRFRDREAKGLSHGGKLEEAIWNKYALDQQGLRDHAWKIRNQLRRE
jgi:5-methylcytosine-specific restriction enzyme A